MSDCVFCKIINRELPAEIVFEDENFLALMSIDPVAVGHVLVIPKEHHRWVWDVPMLEEYFRVVQKVALAQRQAFNTEQILSKVEGSEVPHAHVWVYPLPETPGDKKDFKTHAQKIRENLT